MEVVATVTAKHERLDRLEKMVGRPFLIGVVAMFVELIGELGDSTVPVDTGALRDSRHAVYADGGLRGAQVWGGGDVDYARYVHDGTIYMVGRPWASEALAAAGR